ncbi:hypothetical protein PIB30_116826 [Stylosanthes scabra]|uniref:Copia protein n=1 Tax=Stylosanthes scabra TaxID=79078 RepID=A0ABU6VS63_9FABA|nr:hypothetical protein [Stylosanthes scabra]
MLSICAESHCGTLEIVKRILQFIQGTADQGIYFTKCTDFKLLAFSDANWASDLDDRRSTTGYCIYLRANLISWKCSKQIKVSRSSTEAEYRAIATTQTEIMAIQLLLQELQIPQPHSPTIYCDNMSSCHLPANPIMHSRSKHFETDLFFIRDLVNQKTFVAHINAQDQVADILTKPLSIKLFDRFRSKLRLGKLLSKLEGY